MGGLLNDRNKKKEATYYFSSGAIQQSQCRFGTVYNGNVYMAPPPEPKWYRSRRHRVFSSSSSYSSSSSSSSSPRSSYRTSRRSNQYHQNNNLYDKDTKYDNNQNRNGQQD